LNEALGYGIGNGNEHYGDGAGRLSRGDQRRRGIGDDDVDRQVDQLLGLRSRANGVTRRPAKFDLHVARRRPTELLEASPQCRGLVLPLRIIGGAAH
jgi:hypothetical protein